MSESLDKATRRDIRRAVGPSALKAIADQDAALMHHAKTISALITEHKSLVTRLDTLVARQLTADATVTAHTGMSRWQRMRWVVGL